MKIGWNSAATGGNGARQCIENLAKQLEELNLAFTVEDIVSAISFAWSVAFSAGKLLNSNDLIKGEAIRPMAAQLSENWALVVDAAVQVCDTAKARGLRFREHYQSVNAVAYLWAWCFAALRWRHAHTLREAEKDAFDKRLVDSLERLIDRWLICSQWAGVWAFASGKALANYAAGLATCVKSLAEKSDADSVIDLLKQRLEEDVKMLEPDAINFVASLQAEERHQVRGYYTALWLWNRLDKTRWENAKITLRTKARRQNSIEVDHIVSCDLWQSIIQAVARPLQGTSADEDDRVQLGQEVNQLGNCMLLDKNFNISKGKKPLKEFLQEVHEFKNGQRTITEWSNALVLEAQQVDPAQTSVDDLRKLFVKRTEKIRADLTKFVRGELGRAD